MSDEPHRLDVARSPGESLFDQTSLRARTIRTQITLEPGTGPLTETEHQQRRSVNVNDVLGVDASSTVVGSDLTERRADRFPGPSNGQGFQQYFESDPYGRMPCSDYCNQEWFSLCDPINARLLPEYCEDRLTEYKACCEDQCEKRGPLLMSSDPGACKYERECISCWVGFPCFCTIWWYLRCVCKAFPETAGGKCVRGCLQCKKDAGILDLGPEAHLACRRACEARGLWTREDVDHFAGTVLLRCVNTHTLWCDWCALQFYAMASLIGDPTQSSGCTYEKPCKH